MRRGQARGRPPLAEDGNQSAARHGNTHPGTPEPHPTAAPWPAYDVEDYSYTLRTTCFCADGGVPVTVTVRDGKVTDAGYARTGYGHAAGAPASAWMRVTINDVIDAANTTDAYPLEVRWPAGQPYPTAVWVDHAKNAIDEEIGDTIRNVTPLERGHSRAVGVTGAVRQQAT